MNSLKVVDNYSTDEEATKEQYVINYLKSMVAIEEAMEPFKEQKKEYWCHVLLCYYTSQK